MLQEPKPRKPKAPRATLDEVRDLIAYDRQKGLLIWRDNRRGGAKQGDEAGCVDSRGLVVVTLNGRIYPAARLAWLLAHHQWPKGRIRYKDGNSENLQIDNLVDEATVPSPNKHAQRQRQYRHDVARAKRNIDRCRPDDPEPSYRALYEAYMRDPKAAMTTELNRIRLERRKIRLLKDEQERPSR